MAGNKANKSGEIKQKKFNKKKQGASTDASDGKFNFKWDSNKQQAQGKVFAKKRNKNATGSPTAKTVPSKLLQQTSPTKTGPVIDNDIKKSPFKKKFNFKQNNDESGTKKTFKNTDDSPFKKHFKTKPSETSPEHNDAPDESPEKPVFMQGHIKRKHNKDKAMERQMALAGRHIDITARPRKDYSLFGQPQQDVTVDQSAGSALSEVVFGGGSFSDLDIHRHVLSNIQKIGFTKLTNVQAKSIPVVMSGENALIRSQTGSGKTLAYAVPIIDALQGINPRLKRSDGVQAIIVVPTRELALQTHELFSKINTFQWIITGHLCGGENRKSEKDRIRKGIHVLIGTPGRLLDHVLHTEALKVDGVRCLVLDEADRLLDMGFREDIISLVDHLDKSKTYSDYDPMAMLKHNKEDLDEQDESAGDETIPPLKNPGSRKRQTVLLSATLTKAVSELADFTMKDHTFIDALDDSKTTPQGFVIPSTVKQEFILVHVKHRLFTLASILVAKSKQDNSKIFVFMASTQMVDFHYELFKRYLARMPVNRGKSKVGNVALLENDSDEEDSDDEEEDALDTEFFKLHGSMDQRERKDVFNRFRAGTKGILICTDVAARGVDVPEADCIIQYTGPQSDEDYLHRVGRTGRAGKKGSAILFLTYEEQEYINHLRELKVFVKLRSTDEYASSLCELMEIQDAETAATSLQKRFEGAISKDKALHRNACFAYSTWSRFYSSYPVKMKAYFNFKVINLGHYVSSFGLRDTPTDVSKVVRGEVAHVETPRLNKKLANHKIAGVVTNPQKQNKGKKKKRSMSLVTSEFSSGMEPVKKKMKIKTDFDD